MTKCFCDICKTEIKLRYNEKAVRLTMEAENDSGYMDLCYKCADDLYGVILRRTRAHKNNKGEEK